MKIWFDTEFYENGQTIELISIGMVREDGLTYYAESWDSGDLCSRDDWLMENVQPHLRDVCKHPDEMRGDILAFAGDNPEFWAYYASYDWVALCQIFGRMIDLPNGWPMFCRDIQQWRVQIGNPDLPPQDGAEHDALADAIWNRKAWEHLARCSP